MNEKIIKQALAKLKYTYPNAFKEFTQEDVQFMVKMWSNDFKNDDPKAFETAVERLRVKNKYCPSIAEIKEEIALINNPVLQMNVDEEWEKVIKAIRKYGYYRIQEALDSLNEYTRQIVRTIGWQRLCQSENIEWERRTFKEMFNNKQDAYEDVLVLGEPQLTLAELTRKAKLKEQEALEHRETLYLGE